MLVFVIGSIVVARYVLVIRFKYLKEVTHHRSTKRRKGLANYRDGVTLMSLAIEEDKPNEDVVSLA